MKPILKHTYYALRHAESIPNTKKIIVSAPQEGCKDENGLSSRGIDQAKNVDLTVSLEKRKVFGPLESGQKVRIEREENEIIIP